MKKRLVAILAVGAITAGGALTASDNAREGCGAKCCRRPAGARIDSCRRADPRTGAAVDFGDLNTMPATHAVGKGLVMTEKPKKEEKALSVPEVIWAAARWLAERELLTRIGVVIFLLVVGAAGLAYAQDAGVKYIAPLEARVTALEKGQAEFGRITMETNLNVRLMLESRGIKPIDVPKISVDGGQ